MTWEGCEEEEETGVMIGAQLGEWARCCYFWLLSKAAKPSSQIRGSDL